MPESLLSVPFVVPGFSEADDTYTQQPGALKMVQNGRWRKGGRVSKRVGLNDAGTSVRSGSTALSSSAVPQLITEYRGNHVLGTGGILYHRAADFTAAWSEGDRIGQFTPRRVDPVFRDDVTGPATAPSAAYVSGYICAVCGSDEGETINVVLCDESGNVLYRTSFDGEQPRVVAVGSLFAIVYRDGTDIVGVTLTPSTLALGTPTTITTVPTTLSLFDIAPWSSTQFLLARRSTTTTTDAHHVTAATMAVATTQSITHINDGVGVAPCIFGTVGENVYLVVTEAGAYNVIAQCYDAGLTASVAGPTTLDSTDSNDSQPAMYRVSSTSVRVVWGGQNSGLLPRLMSCTYDTSGAVGTVQTVYGAYPASRPFDGTADRFRVWAAVYASAAEQIFQRHALLTVETASATNPVVHAELITDAGTADPTEETDIRWHIPAVVTATSDYLVPLCDVLRADATPDTNFGVNLYRFYSTSQSARHAHRGGVEAAGALHITGGVMTEHIGGSGGADELAAIENGFLYPPVIVGSSQGTSGGLTQGATYQYVAVFEYLDTAGRRHRSAPSNVRAVTLTGSNDDITLNIQALGISGRLHKDGATVAIHIYRTDANGGTFKRITANSTAPAASTYVGTVAKTYTDTGSGDDGEILYTDGGVFGNWPCPSHRFAVRGGGRVWVGGLWNENLVAFSKLIVPGEPVQFVEADQFRLLVPEPVTGLGYMDGTLVIFTSGGAYLVSGDGPNDQGVPTFGEPQRLPMDIGCSDWRTVQEIPQGLLYQSARGFYLLPRGFGPPVFVGAAVQETVQSYPLCFGVGRVGTNAHSSTALGESSLVFVMGDAEVPTATRSLVWDLNRGMWASVDTYGSDVYTAAGTWSGNLAVVNTALTQVRSTSTASGATIFGDAGSFVELHCRTGTLHPFGFGGFGHLRKLTVLGELRGGSASNLGIRVTIDGKAQYTLTPSNATAIATVNGSGLSRGDKFWFEYALPLRRMSNIDVELWDSYNSSLGSTSDEGLAFNGIVLHVEPDQGSKRLGAAQRE